MASRPQRKAKIPIRKKLTPKSDAKGIKMMELTVPCLVPIERLFFIKPGLEVRFNPPGSPDAEPKNCSIINKQKRNRSKANIKVTFSEPLRTKPTPRPRPRVQKLLPSKSVKNDSAKPGTVASRQTIGLDPLRSGEQSKIDWEAERMCRMTRLADSTIDHGVLDEKTLISPKEFACRSGLDELPSNIMDLCKNFIVEIPRIKFDFSDSPERDLHG